MQLHKLAYCCQAWHLVWEDRLLADADFYAWGTGPVNPNLHASHAGTFTISGVPGNPGVFDADEAASIDEVVKAYGELRAFHLTAIVKNEDPWKSAWSGTEPGQRGRLIEADRMQSFYVELDGEPVGAAVHEGA
ncbi:Panacea domain-containing protein [Arthrobacter sp. SLBN-100]|uniref:Panacea domain-containing protein n=1 Tax=Arthrobacter sp. SLBN-100 TaxID=2768450 RepID=UPI00114DDA10|nr:type II toxin-antitoxin system antitoxin SocA domain-containing protein [Arthrobacter sp. SLBN-100]